MAELLIALLAVSVIVSATIPTFTRKASTNEQVFKFVDDNTGSGYGSSGNSSSIIVGGNRSIDETNNYTGYDAADQINAVLKICKCKIDIYIAPDVCNTNWSNLIRIGKRPIETKYKVD